MWRNYLLVALRNLRRHRVYAGINVFGLAVGMAGCLLILLFVRDEVRYDRHHANADRIARLVRQTSALSAAPMGPAMAANLPGVAQAARIMGEGDVLVERADGAAFTETVYTADSSFFNIFNCSFVQGSPQTALTRPDALVLSRSAAEKYFGDENPLGQTLTVRFEEPVVLTVTGVVEDWPRTAHFRFDLMTSFEWVAQRSRRMENWRTNWLFTYLLLEEGATAAEVEARLPAFFERHTSEAWDHFGIQPLLDIHLRSAHLEYDIAPQGNIAYVYLFSAVALLILLVACINFMNLATARSMQRAREVGMRKVLGAHKGQLIAQFMSESLLLAGLALAVAAGLTSVLLPAFRDLTGKDLVLAASDGVFLGLGLVGLALFVGLVAGSYPAFFLAAFKPIQTLKGTAQPGAAGGLLRRGLVVFQFAISIFLIAGTFVIYRQLAYVQNTRLGFEKAQTLMLDFGDRLGARYELVKREVLQHPNVLAATASDNVPGAGVSDFLYRPEGWPENDLPGWDTYFVDPEYTDVLGMEMAQGRAFSREIASDTSGFLINEAALAQLRAEGGAAWNDPLGKQLDFYLPGAEGWQVARTGPIVGVVKDFHYRSLHAEIGPLVMQVVPFTFDYLLVKVATDDLAGTLAFLDKKWQALGPEAPFTYTFLDAQYDALYQTEQRVGTLFGLFAALSILIACLGLFGLAAFTAERRTKEIGVRKVMGASVGSIALLLSKQFARLVGVAFLVATPLAYLAAGRWLDDFAYRTETAWWIFALAGLAALAVALATVSYHAIRAALTDPVEALRYE